MYITLGEFLPEEVFPYVPELNSRRVPKHIFEAGDSIFRVKMNSLRLKVFKANPFCVCCGIAGVKFLLQAVADETPHLNFYALDINNNYIMLTKDHLHPQSLGGSNNFENLQTMCSKCNELKSDSFISNEDLKTVIDEYNRLLNTGTPHNQAIHIIEKIKKEIINGYCR